MDKQEQDDFDPYELMDAILWGYRIVNIDGKTFAFKPLSLRERNIANHVRDQSMDEALRKGCPKKNDLYIDAMRRGIWSKINDDHIQALSDELDRRKEDLSSTRQKSKIKVINRRINAIEDSLRELMALRFSIIDAPSAEFYALQQQLCYVVQCSTYTFPDLRIKWPTYDDFESESDTSLITNLINIYHEGHNVDELGIRKLARDSIWRIRWIAAKQTGLESLFRSGLDSLTLEQQLLLNWSLVYDSVYDSMDRPPEYIINDNDELDKWLKKQGEEAEQDRKKRFYEKKTNRSIGKKSKYDANEVMVPVDGFYLETCNCGALGKRGQYHAKSCPHGVFVAYKDKDRIMSEVNKVQSTNPDPVRIILAKEQQAVEKRGWVPEQDLRTELSRKALGLSTNIHRRDKK